MKYLVYFLIVVLGPVFSVAGIFQDKCTGFDYSKRFGPVRDQDGHGYCHAFTSAALVEEFLCKKDVKNCGKSISPLDISRCHWSLLSKEEGSYINGSLDCAINNGGVCFEENAPYNALTDLRCTLWELFTDKGVKCKNEKLAALFTKWKKSCPLTKETENQNSISALEKDLIQSLRNKVPEELLTGKDLKSLFDNSSSESDFLKNILISNACEKNRNNVNAVVEKMVSPNLNDKLRQDVMVNFIAKGLRSNSSGRNCFGLGAHRLAWV
ncbi:MAG: C1 family peptidase [Pseudobdellovibrionaceae bacterium]